MNKPGKMVATYTNDAGQTRTIEFPDGTAVPPDIRFDDQGEWERWFPQMIDGHNAVELSAKHNAARWKMTRVDPA
jgi:hypothetical protein